MQKEGVSGEPDTLEACDSGLKMKSCAIACGAAAESASGASGSAGRRDGRSAGAAGLVGAFMPVYEAVSLVPLVEFGPLFRREHGADAEQHLGAGHFEVSTAPGDLFNLCRCLRRIDRIGAQKRLEEDFLLLHVGAEIDELQLALLEGGVHALDLV